MDERRRSGIVFGLILVLVGAALLTLQLAPGLRVWISGKLGWPLIVVGLGLVLLIAGYLTRTPGMAVASCVVAGLGVLFYWQELTDSWGSWAYAWTLLPGFAGLGTIVAGPIRGTFGRSLRDGLWQIIISAALFMVFGAFLGGPNVLGIYWPALLIGLGLLMLLRLVFERR